MWWLVFTEDSDDDNDGVSDDRDEDDDGDGVPDDEDEDRDTDGDGTPDIGKFKLQWKNLNVINLGPSWTDNINWMITITFV